ncbi:cytochrome P450 [Kitasatospora sp. NPDC057692]|uniref:cytochrome P450 family protein n=1 Tax=Kitasatospora sp. NPDC057692 TaxID=3346215 RepID=UPI0036CE7538
MIHRPCCSGNPDIFDSAYFDDPEATFAHLREAHPVMWARTPEGVSVWLVTRYDDIRAVLSNPLFSASKQNSSDARGGAGLPPALDANLLNMDPPDHTRIRRLVSGAFTASRIEGMREKAHTVAHGLVDGFAEKGKADLIKDFAGPFPTRIISELLGIETSEYATFQNWIGILFEADPSDGTTIRRTVGLIVEFLRSCITEKRRNLQDDLLSAMISARDTHGSLTDDELTSLASLILFAGYENTVHLIGNSVLALLDEGASPDSLQVGITDAAISELIRFRTPGPYATRRFAVQDAILYGRKISAGDSVLLCLSSANHDERAYRSASSLQLTRAERSSLTFGHGIHYCLGAPLARLELQVALEVLGERLRGIRLDVSREQLLWRPSFRSRGLVSLPVSFTTRRGSHP